MKALTLHQPWASLTAIGVRTIETRSWGTEYRGRLAIHAGKRAPEKGDYGDWYVDQADIYSSPPHIAPAQPTTRGWSEGPTPNSRTDRLPWLHREWGMADDRGQGLYYPLPLGAVVATCDLVDVVPIVAYDTACAADLADLPVPRIETEVSNEYPDGVLHLYHPTLGSALDPDTGRTIIDQAAFGDFSPGRYAWLLDNIEATTSRCPACWGHPFYVCASDLSGGAVCGVCARESHRFTTPRSHDLLAGCPCCAADHTARGCWTCDGKGSCDPIPARGRQGLWEWENRA